MGTQVSDVVAITISRETAKITRTGFGTPLLLGEDYKVYDRVTSYSTLAEMVTAGYATTDELYKMAAKLLAQEYSPPSFKVGRKYANVNSKCTLAFTGTPSAGTWTLDVSIAGATAVTSGSITYAANDDTATIKSVLEAMDGITAVTVTGLYSTGYTIEFTGADAADDFRISGPVITSLTGVTACVATMTQYGSATETWTEAIANCRIADDDWYCLLTVTRTKADILLCAAAIELLTKFYLACTGDAVVITSADDDIVSELQDLSYDRTAIIYSSDYANYPDACWAGLQLPKTPGSTTWKFKNLAGITADDLTTAEVGYVLAKEGNYYESIAGLSVISSEGVVVSGEYIDVIRGADELQVALAEDIYTLLVNAEKIPFTTPGIGVIENAIRYRVQKKVDDGFIAENTLVVTVPDIDDVEASEKAVRWLNGVTFSATLSGAIHKVTITGKLQV